MIGTHLLLEDFSTTRSSAQSDLDDEPLEDLKLKAFEDGYRAGWDDAIVAQKETGDELVGALKSAVDKAGLELKEARTIAAAEAAGLCAIALGKVLPSLSQDILSLHIQTLLQSTHANEGDPGVCITCSKATCDVVRKLFEDRGEVVPSLSADNSLQVGQVFIKVNDRESRIDMDAVISGILAAIEKSSAASQQE